MDKIETKKTALKSRTSSRIRDVEKSEENLVSAMEFCGAASDEFPTFDEIRSSRTINTISCLCTKKYL